MNTSKKGLSTQLHQRKRSKKSKSDDWWTPKWLFKILCLIYDFHPKLDVSASYLNTKCEYYLDKKWNALEQDWWYGMKVTRKSRKTGKPISYSWHWFEDHKLDIWCNPPNKDLGKFMLKAYEQYKKFRKDGMRIMMIVPTNTMSSNAFWDAIELPKDRGEMVSYKPIYKRIEFLEKGKDPEFGARNAYLVVIWGKRNINIP